MGTRFVTAPEPLKDPVLTIFCTGAPGVTVSVLDEPLMPTEYGRPVCAENAGANSKSLAR